MVRININYNNNYNITIQFKSFLENNIKRLGVSTINTTVWKK